jgi:hypothetical protein
VIRIYHLTTTSCAGDLSGETSSCGPTHHVTTSALQRWSEWGSDLSLGAEEQGLPDPSDVPPTSSSLMLGTAFGF